MWVNPNDMSKCACRNTSVRLQSSIKCILLPNHTAMRSTPHSALSQGSSTRSSSTTTSLATHSMSETETSYKDLILSQLAHRFCVPINAAPTHPPITLTITRAPSNVSNIDPTDAPPPPIVHFGKTPKTTATSKRQQENCSALAHHLFAHLKNLRFDT